MYSPTINFFDRQLSEGWLSLSGADRLKKTRGLIKKFLSQPKNEEKI